MQYDNYNFSSKTIDVDGYEIHYVDEGKGDTVLMLHGNPTWSYVYRHQIRALRDSYRCIALDYLGYGLSDKPKNADYSIRAHISRLDTFVAKLGLEDITLVVQDWGGVIGLNWACHHKPLVKRLVILNTGVLPIKSGELLRIRPLPWAFLFLWSLRIPVWGELFVQGFNGFARFLTRFGMHQRGRFNKDAMAGYISPYPTWGSRRAHLKMVRQIPLEPGHPTWQLLREITKGLTDWNVPAQIIWGLRDPVFVPWFLEELEKRLCNRATSFLIEDASHFLQDDKPEQVTAKIREFLRNNAFAPRPLSLVSQQSLAAVFL